MTLYRSALLLIVELLAACQTAQPRHSRPPALSPQPVEALISIAPADQPGYWRVSYQLPVAVSEFRFARTGANRRGWRVNADLMRWRTEAGEAVVEARDGSEFQRLELWLPEDLRTYAKDYALFKRFSDGGLLLYTGHLRPHAQMLGGQTPRYVWSAPGRQVIAQGRVASEQISWLQADEAGSYIYAGTGDALITATGVVVTDAGLPGWQRALFDQGLPALMAEFDRELGSLGQRISVYASYRDSGQAGRFRDGGTLPAVLQMETSGDGWRSASSAARLEFLQLLAHELAHLWNRAWITEDLGQAWISEGGAEALAWSVLRASGQLSEAQLQMNISEKLNLCIFHNQRVALDQAAGEGRYAALYDCGALLMLATGARLQQLQPTEGVLQWWRLLLAEATSPAAAPGAERYLELLASAVDQDFAARQQALLDQRQPTGEAWLALLRDAGYELAEAADQPMPQALSELLRREAFFSLMASDCGGWVSFNADSAGISSNANERCSAFASPRRVTTIAGLPLADAEGVYREVRRICAEAGEVQLDGPGEGDNFSLRCSSELPEPAPVYSVRRSGG